MKQYESEVFSNMPKSYWIASTEKTDYPKLTGNIKVDVLIIGGGISGLTCAYLLKKEGLSVAILEAGRIANGTTGHTTAKITSQHGLIYSKLKSQLGIELASKYAFANESAIHEIKGIIDELMIECDYTPQSAVVYTKKDGLIEKIEEEVDAALSLGIKASFMDSIPFSIPIKGAVAFHNQAQFHPRKYVLALAKSFVAEGGLIFENTKAVGLEEIHESTDKYMVETEAGARATGKKVIVATHFPFYNKLGMYFSRIYSERSYVVALKTKEKYPGGMYICEEDPTRSLRGQSFEDQELVLFGGENHKTGQGENTKDHYQALIEEGNKIFTVQDIPYYWSTQDCMTLDQIPYVGHFTSNTPDLYILTGFNKWGMTNSMVSSMILRDLIVKGESPWKDVYSPSRDATLSAAVEFVVENFDVGKHLVKGKVQSNLDINEIELMPDQGKVVELKGERLGIYRDFQGVLHIVNTTCTHMGCELNWNAAERTWDCPCHGSRFSIDGEVVEGPAVKSLSINYDVNTLKKLFTEDF